MLAELFFALLGFAFNYKRKPLKIALSPLLTVMAAVGIVFIFNLSIKSIFINFNNPPTDPYYINLTPASIFKEIVLYAKEAFSFLHGIVIVIVGIGLLNALFFWNEKNKVVYIMIACLFGIVLSWAPNALIPNHHFGGYSFNGNYFFYLPLLAIPLIKTRGTLTRASIAMLMLVCVTSPLANKADYDNQWWVLEQEGIQRNLLRELDTLMNAVASLGDQQKILITGLTMPFHPFRHPLFLKEYPNSNFAIYDVVDYSIEMEREDSVKFIKPSDVRVDEYTSIWIFAGNGSLLRNVVLDEPTKEIIKTNQYQDLIVYPDSEKAKILGTSLK